MSRTTIPASICSKGVKPNVDRHGNQVVDLYVVGPIVDGDIEHLPRRLLDFGEVEAADHLDDRLALPVG